MKRTLLTAGALSLLGAFVFSSHLTAPFNLSHQGWNGGHYGIAARNFLRYGYASVGFMPCVEPGAVITTPQLYLRHPPGASLLASVSVRLLGESEMTLRLPFYLLSVATVPLLFLWLLRAFRGRQLLAAAATITAMSTPVWIFYGHQVEPIGSGVLFSLAGTLLCADRWFEKRRLGDLLACGFFLLFGFATDWITFYFAGLLGLICLVGRDGPGPKWALVCWAFAVGCGIGMFLWIRHVGAASGFGLPQLFATALHRIGWVGDFVDDSGRAVTFAQFVSGLGSAHGRMFLRPISVLGALASLLLLLRFMRRRGSREALWLVPLGAGVLHIVAFPQAVFQHEYCQLLLSLGLAIPPVALVFVWTRNGAHAVVDRTALLLSLVVLAFGVSRVQELWAYEDIGISRERAAGQMLRARVAPEETVLSSERTMTPPVIFYADRKNAVASEPEALAELAHDASLRVGGLVLRDEDVEVFRTQIEKLGWEGPVHVPGYSFWDADP